MFMVLQCILLAITFAAHNLIGMNPALPGNLPQELWISIFNRAALRSQLNLEQVNRALKAVYENNQVYYNNSIQFGVVEYWIGTFFSNLADIFSEKKKRSLKSFCDKLTTKKIRGSITFTCNNSQVFASFVDSICHNPHITHLQILQASFLNDFDLQKLTLENKPEGLKSITINNTNITYKEVSQLLDRLPQVEELNINHNNKLTNKAGYYGGYMDHKNANNHDLEILSRAIKNLKKLSMMNCDIQEYQTLWIINFLKEQNTKLEELYLAQNPISPAWAEILIEASKTPGRPLRFFDLAENCKIAKPFNAYEETLIPFF
jgi:hypothetical protein